MWDAFDESNGTALKVKEVIKVIETDFINSLLSKWVINSITRCCVSVESFILTIIFQIGFWLSSSYVYI